VADKSRIEWTEATWNPTTGCDRVSPGCDHCYALSLAPRLKAMGSARYQRDGDPRTSGPGFGLTLHSDTVGLPMRWTRPRRIFVNSMSDLFHADVPDRFIADVFAVMTIAEQHTFQVLTKRHGRMRSLLTSVRFWHAVSQARNVRGFSMLPSGPDFEPPANVWLGVSVEDQKRADLRIPALLDTPAAVRWLSMEPLLGPIDLGIDDPHRGHESDDVHGHPHPPVCVTCSTDDSEVAYFRRNPVREGLGLDWVVVGGESGLASRPMQIDWARSLRDQCTAAGVPFFLKQWGGRTPKANGRELDGRTWDEYPEDHRA
jgi:protein gp37